MKLKKVKMGGEIVYTLKEEYEGKKTEDAHYKFVKIRGVKDDKLPN